MISTTITNKIEEIAVSLSEADTTETLYKDCVSRNADAENRFSFMLQKLMPANQQESATKLRQQIQGTIILLDFIQNNAYLQIDAPGEDAKYNNFPDCKYPARLFLYSNDEIMDFIHRSLQCTEAKARLLFITYHMYTYEALQKMSHTDFSLMGGYEAFNQLKEVAE